MLSQLNLRFPKSLIAALKNRAAAEAVPVNTLAERLLQQTLATSVAGDEYRALCAAPYTTLGQLYRKVVRAETVDGQALSRAELRWLFSQAQIAYRDGRGPVNRAPLSALLLITDALLETAVGGGLDVDPHYYRRTFGLRGEDWLQALRDRFTATCTPPAGSAEFFARPVGQLHVGQGDQPPDHGDVPDRRHLPGLCAGQCVNVKRIGFDQQVDVRQVCLIAHRAIHLSGATEARNPVLQKLNSGNGRSGHRFSLTVYAESCVPVRREVTD